MIGMRLLAVDQNLILLSKGQILVCEAPKKEKLSSRRKSCLKGWRCVKQRHSLGASLYKKRTWSPVGSSSQTHQWFTPHFLFYGSVIILGCVISRHYVWSWPAFSTCWGTLFPVLWAIKQLLRKEQRKAREFMPWGVACPLFLQGTKAGDTFEWPGHGMILPNFHKRQPLW